jgi:lipid II:glycine glycyltransferase (peptidoglycan interpeptide bridge formation enzyme)
MGQKLTFEISSLDSISWSRLLAQFSDASIYQTWSYGSIRWGRKNLNHVIIRKDGEIIGAAQVCVRKVPGLQIGVAYVPWGPLWNNRDREPDYEDFRFIVRSLAREYCERRKLVLRIDPNLFATDKNAAHIIEAEGLKPRPLVLPYRTLMVDLSSSLAEIRKRLDQKWRNQLNRAEKNGLLLVEGNSALLYRVFLDLQKQMLERKAFIPGVDYDEFRKIQEDLPESLKMHVVVAEFEGEPVAVAVASGIGDAGIYLFGATGDKGIKLKGSYLIQWRMIQWLKASGSRWYDLGGINPEKNPGVFHFKSGLSGIDLRHLGLYESRANNASRFMLDLAETLRHHRRFRKLALGNLLKGKLRAKSV